MKKYTPLPSADYLNECFSYEPETGVLQWKHRPLAHFRDSRQMNAWNAKYPNQEAGSIMPNGYRVVSVNHRRYLAHRLIFKIMTGDDPPEQLDHRNCKSSDNTWENLRVATNGQNGCNKGAQRNNVLGLKGVYFKASHKRFEAQIVMNGKRSRLGLFRTALEAHQAYCEASKLYHGDFGNVGKVEE